MSRSSEEIIKDLWLFNVCRHRHLCEACANNSQNRNEHICDYPNREIVDRDSLRRSLRWLPIEEIITISFNYIHRAVLRYDHLSLRRQDYRRDRRVYLDQVRTYQRHQRSRREQHQQEESDVVPTQPAAAEREHQGASDSDQQEEPRWLRKPL